MKPFAAAVLLMATLPSLASAPRKLALGEDARFELVVEKTGLMKGKRHVFSFPKLEGSVTFDPPLVDLAVEARPAVLHDDWVSEKDRRRILEFTHSPAMLDTGRHPRITFRSSQVNELGDGRYQVRGLLTLRGLSREVEAAVIRRGQQFTGNAVFPMSRFGMEPPKAALGAVGTRDEVSVQFTLIAQP